MTAVAASAAGAGPAPTRVDRRKARTRRALVDAARALLVERGTDDVSIQEITTRADVGFGSFTFTHTIEDRIAGILPFPLYEPQPLPVEFTDAAGQHHATTVRVISEDANARRDERPFIDRLQRSGVLKSLRVGNSRVLLARCAAMIRLIQHAGPPRWNAERRRWKSLFRCPRGPGGH